MNRVTLIVVLIIVVVLGISISNGGCSSSSKPNPPSSYVLADSDYPVFPNGFLIRVAVPQDDAGVHFKVFNSSQIEIDPGLDIEILGEMPTGVHGDGLIMWSYNCVPVNWEFGQTYTVKVFDGSTMLESIKYEFMQKGGS